MADPIIADLRAWRGVAELQTGTIELALLKLAASQPIPVLPVDERELTLLLLRERDHFRRALAVVESLIGVDQGA